MKIQKTNAMRILDSNRLPYEVFSYAHGIYRFRNSGCV